MAKVPPSAPAVPAAFTAEATSPAPGHARTVIEHPLLVQSGLRPPAIGSDGLNFLEFWLAERRRFKPRKQAALDERVLRLRHDVLLQHLQPDASVLLPGAPDLRPAFAFAFDEGYSLVKGAMAGQPLAVHGRHHYPAVAKVKANPAWDLFTGIRDLTVELVKEEDDQAGLLIRQRAGYGSRLTKRNLIGLADALSTQLELCRDPQARVVMSGRGLYPDAWIARLEPMVREFVTAVQDGSGQETTLSEQDTALQQGLWAVEIVLTRGMAFVDAWVSPAAAKALEAVIPWRHRRGQAAAEEAPGEQGGKLPPAGQGTTGAPGAPASGPVAGGPVVPPLNPAAPGAPLATPAGSGTPAPTTPGPEGGAGV